MQNQLFLLRKCNVFLLSCQKPCNMQWLVEMLLSFLICILHFLMKNAATIFDLEVRINPFTTESLIICPPNWLETHPNKVELVLNAQFDCLIVDEAHHLVRSETSTSTAYLLVEQLARIIPSVLLILQLQSNLGKKVILLVCATGSRMLL